MNRIRLASLVLASVIGLSSCADHPVQPPGATADATLAKGRAASPHGTFILIARGNSLPPGLEKRIQEAGGAVQSVLPKIGVAIVASEDPHFARRAERIPGVQSAVTDVAMQLIEPPKLGGMVSLQSFGNPPASGDDDIFFDLQWGHDAIDAPEAWNATAEFGAGVRVCVMDSGIDRAHPDLAPNVNIPLSRSFVPGETPFVQPGFFFSHGTHVAGTIAAADNAFGIIGVAPQAELVSLKVLPELGGSGTFGALIEALYYAGTIGCDVVNMSIGAYLPRSGFRDDDGRKVVNANELAQLINATKRAATFAFQQGSTLIASAGNDALNRNRTADLVHLPSDLPHVLTVGAYGPVGWALNPFAPDEIFFRPASYTNYGQRAIDVSAPGGDFVLPGEAPCTIAGLARPCWVFDLVFSTIAGGWAWAAGTSMAAPHASGVAALIIGQHGGELHPAQVRSILIRTAEDIGKPGKDPFFGHGTVNAYFALTGTTGTPNTPSP